MAKTLTATAVKNCRPDKRRREVPDGGCPGLHLVVQPNGKKSWALRFRRPGGKLPAKLVLGSVFETADKEPEIAPVVGGYLTLAGARRLVTTLRHEIAQGRDPAATHIAEKKRRRGEEKDNNFKQIALEFITQHRVKRTGKRPRRWREVARVLGLSYPPDGGEPLVVRGGLADRWADKAIGAIDGHDVYGVVEESRRVGIPGVPPRNTGPSDARGRKMADALGSLFKWAMMHKRGFMLINPCLGGYRPSAPSDRDRVLNFRADVRRADELRWFWFATNAIGEPFGALLKLLLLTGCRLNEIAQMTQDELSDDVSSLRLPGVRTKNNRPHDVPLPLLAREVIVNCRRIEACRYVFSTNGRTPVSGFSKIKRRLDALMLAEAEKERGTDTNLAPWRLHDLRRTAATGMASLGIAPYIVEAALNHVSGAKAGVAGTYNREQYEPQKRAALERWASHIGGLVSNNIGVVVPLLRA